VDNVYYRLIEPDRIWNQLKRSTRRLNQKDVAKAIGTDPSALARALAGERVWASTIEKIADAIHENPADIAQEA
jgi:transcriptional regulator with XRE-family HTH domain